MASGEGALRVVQLTDTHFLADGSAPEGGFAYNTDEAFAAVADDIGHAGSVDLVVVTGDVVDLGTDDEYRKAGDALSRLGWPVNVCPGNHDRSAAYSVGVARPNVSTSKAVRLGNWLFLFVDSNAGSMELDQTGRLIDPSDIGKRLHQNGSLGAREAAWIVEAGQATDADHIFIWVHHPPFLGIPLFHDEAYNDEWSAILPSLPKLRGLGAGHTHTPKAFTIAEQSDLSINVGPSLKSNFDLAGATLLPPGYCLHQFNADGSFDCEFRFVGEDRWPRIGLPVPAQKLFRGELNYEEARNQMRSSGARTTG